MINCRDVVIGGLISFFIREIRRWLMKREKRMVLDFKDGKRKEVGYKIMGRGGGGSSIG